ncbi:pyridoxamine 5'-phosphate oxidase family protein [Paenibacillus aestuarii]|uniref:Pyridoxamine 5'-phosphate oxidase family protein n=1 Tax=Paenibacillus aestuarii TaxID=516965 RepID=A0ABW0KID5_9BACL|nr:pyridoxamine 5'-phosphate oxidase family protein [Paenibacillus aestuarii]
MYELFHEGELMVQFRAGENVIAAQNANMITSHFSNGMIHFLISQQFAILSSKDSKGDVWVTWLTGQPGFIKVLDENKAIIKSKLIAGDPLALHFIEQKQIGLLIIDTNRRIRLRINGVVTKHENQFIVTAKQIYGNCPKYIQKRSFQPKENRLLKSKHQSEELNRTQEEWISKADTFYIGSVNNRGEMDASHRGGNQGFVHVIDSRTLLFPDYSGNSMFNTLGNIQLNPSSGLLFIDYDHGHSLHMTGLSEIIWDKPATAAFPGARRLVRFEIKNVVQLNNATEMQWEFTEMSPFNPKPEQ